MEEKVEDTVQTEVRTVALQEASEVHADIKMGMGDLQIQGGAEALLDAEFVYNMPDWQPNVEYQVLDGRGDLVIAQPDSRLRERPGRLEYRWGLRFCNDIPLDLAVKLGNGDANLRLDGLALTALDANIANGRLSAVVGGDIPELKTVSLNTANGKSTLNMQGHYTALQSIVLAAASGKLGIGLVGAYPALKEFSAKTMSGNIQLTLDAMCNRLEKLQVGSVSGVIDLDLAESNWQHNVEVELHGVSGTIKVRLPDGIGVAVNVKKLSGTVDAPGFRQERGLYMNAAYGKSEVTLYLDIATVSGRIKVLQPDKEESRNIR